MGYHSPREEGGYQGPPLKNSLTLALSRRERGLVTWIPTLEQHWPIEPSLLSRRPDSSSVQYILGRFQLDLGPVGNERPSFLRE